MQDQAEGATVNIMDLAHILHAGVTLLISGNYGVIWIQGLFPCSTRGSSQEANFGSLSSVNFHKIWIRLCFTIRKKI